MSKIEEGLKIMEQCCGNGKDNVIALSTLCITEDGKTVPAVRDVDAFYEDGVFYISTWGKSNKVKQIEQNEAVAFAVPFEGIYGNGIGRNLGWVLEPQNAEIRAKLRTAFADWYDQANDEQCKDCVIVAVYVTFAKIFRDHGAVYHEIDFSDNKVTK